MNKYPHSIESEQAVICAMLLKTECVDIVSEKIRDLDFYLPQHRMIYRAILSLREKTPVIDQLTLTEELKHLGYFEDIKHQYVLELYDNAVTAHNLNYHLENIVGKAVLRAIVDQCSSIIQTVNNNETDPDDIADDAETRMMSIRDRYIKDDMVRSSDILQETLKEMEAYQKGEKTGLTTPWDDLNRITAGFHPAELTIIACRPSVGKTAMALNITDHLTIDNNIPVLFFSLEMKPTQLQQRMLCARAGVSLHGIRTGTMSNDDWTKIAGVSHLIDEAPIVFDGSTSLSINAVRAKARRARRQNKIEIIFIDYLQLIHGPKSESREREITGIAQQLKEMARELDIPVVALSQMSRAVELRGDNAKPKLSDLRESGAIEQEADVVIFLHRNYDKEAKQYDSKTLVDVAKQRHGPTRGTYLYFEKKYTTFTPLSRREG